MSEIVHTSMKQQVYDIIKKRILSQEYDLGDFLNIQTLSKEFSVSNTPIREALSMLCAEGLVISNANSKFRVVELNEQKLQELNETTFSFLSGAYISCYKSNRCQQLIHRLEKIFQKQQKAYDDGDRTILLKAAFTFDRCFVEVTENSKLISLFDDYSTLLLLAFRYNYQHTETSLKECLEEHRGLLEAVRELDHPKVIELLYQHYDKHFSERK